MQIAESLSNFAEDGRPIPEAEPYGRAMSRIFVTGSTDGLGRAAARALMNDGHQVVLHARSQARTSAFADLAPRSAGVVIGDLGSGSETRRIADAVNAIGGMDAVIHNAGTYSTTGRSPTAEGHAAILAVNTLAPYISDDPMRESAAATGIAAVRGRRPGTRVIRDFKTSSRPSSPS